MNLIHEMEGTALALVARGKGILAADESPSTLEKRFRSAGIEPSEENRRAYRELLCTTPGIGAFVSGVILQDETIRQKGADGTSLVELLHAHKIIAGIKVDRGAKPLAGSPGEKITEGLDGLRERLAEYAQLGARFTKWRAVFTVGPRLPTLAALHANAHALARFAALSQEAGLVPIVEPEVLMDGDHSIERHEEATAAALRCLFPELLAQHVRLEAMLLKPNMVVAGDAYADEPSVLTAAEATLRCMRRHVPAAVPGLVFLSGGQSETRATEHLNAMNRLDRAPWELSFSFGRALQAPALKLWAGNSANLRAAQEALHHRAACNSAARLGTYTPEVERSKQELPTVATAAA